MTQPLDSAEMHAHLEWLSGPVRMGWLRRQASGCGEGFSFEYDPEWLATPAAFTFDPDLAHVPKRGRRAPWPNGIACRASTMKHDWCAPFAARRGCIRKAGQDLTAPAFAG